MSALDNLRNAAKRWLKALRAGDARALDRLRGALSDAPDKPGLRDVQHALAREHGYESWKSLRDAHHQDVLYYAGIACDVVAVHDRSDPMALARLQHHFGPPFTVEQFREGVTRRLSGMPSADRPKGSFALPHAQLLVAREAGYANWNALTTALTSPSAPLRTHDRGMQTDDLARGDASDPSARMLTPIEVQAGLPLRIEGANNERSAVDVWRMLNACRTGDVQQVASLAEACPALVLCTYNYMAPLHLAVREGHVEVVQFLADRGAANPNYVTYPYRETLVTVARDRGFADIATRLEACYRDGDRSRKEDEGDEIVYVMDDMQRRFQKLVNDNATGDVEAMLRERSDLAAHPLMFWGEGVLMMPAKQGRRPMLELLLQYGAHVPDMSKWGAWYYLWLAPIAAYLLEHGMNANHRNCHHTTVLHDMAYKGDTGKGRLLLDHGADVNAVDEEFRSTPLGLAARWGHREMVALLLERGADPNRSGAPWATPLAWALKRGHGEIAARLRTAGAVG